MIIEDEVDIFTLYKDYLIQRGHEIICSSLNANNIMVDFDINRPDIAIMDYKLTGHKNGIDAATEILTDYPQFPILFITAYEQLRKDILGYPIFKGKKIQILLKPATLKEIEDTVLNLVSSAIL